MLNKAGLNIYLVGSAGQKLSLSSWHCSGMYPLGFIDVHKGLVAND